MFLTITNGTEKSVLTYPFADADLPSFASVLQGELSALNSFALHAKKAVGLGLFDKNYSQEFEGKEDSSLVVILSAEIE